MRAKLGASAAKSLMHFVRPISGSGQRYVQISLKAARPVLHQSLVSVSKRSFSQQSKGLELEEVRLNEAKAKPKKEVVKRFLLSEQFVRKNPEIFKIDFLQMILENGAFNPNTPLFPYSEARFTGMSRSLTPFNDPALHDYDSALADTEIEIELIEDDSTNLQDVKVEIVEDTHGMETPKTVENEQDSMLILEESVSGESIEQTTQSTLEQQEQDQARARQRQAEREEVERFVKMKQQQKERDDALRAEEKEERERIAAQKLKQAQEERSLLENAKQARAARALEEQHEKEERERELARSKETERLRIQEQAQASQKRVLEEQERELREKARIIREREEEARKQEEAREKRKLEHLREEQEAATKEQERRAALKRLQEEQARRAEEQRLQRIRAEEEREKRERKEFEDKKALAEKARLEKEKEEERQKRAKSEEDRQREDEKRKRAEEEKRQRVSTQPEIIPVPTLYSDDHNENDALVNLEPLPFPFPPPIELGDNLQGDEEQENPAPTTKTVVLDDLGDIPLSPEIAEEAEAKPIVEPFIEPAAIPPPVDIGGSGSRPVSPRSRPASPFFFSHDEEKIPKNAWNIQLSPSHTGERFCYIKQVEPEERKHASDASFLEGSVDRRNRKVQVSAIKDPAGAHDYTDSDRIMEGIALFYAYMNLETRAKKSIRVSGAIDLETLIQVLECAFAEGKKVKLGGRDNTPLKVRVPGISPIEISNNMNAQLQIMKITAERTELVGHEAHSNLLKLNRQLTEASQSPLRDLKKSVQKLLAEDPCSYIYDENIQELDNSLLNNHVMAIPLPRY